MYLLSSIADLTVFILLLSEWLSYHLNLVFTSHFDLKMSFYAETVLITSGVPYLLPLDLDQKKENDAVAWQLT